MPKVPDPDKILKAVMQNLKKSGVLDDVAKAGGNLADDISRIMSEMTGKAAKPVKPAKPKLPKNPPKSRPAAKEKPLTPAEYASAQADNKYLRSKGKELLKEEKTIGTGSMGEDDLAILKLYKDGVFSNKAPKGPKPKSPKPKSPKSGSADKMESEAIKKARYEKNSATWAKQREAYNKMKAIERQERKAANRAKWAATLEEKYGGNIVEARKATSKGRNRNKKDKK